MIQLSNVTVQHGSQILFKEAGFQIPPQSRIGLVGPNGAGKSTIFRLIVGIEKPDAGDISIPKKTVLGYFSQDTGEMSGKTAIEQTMSFAAEVIALGEEIKKMEAALCEPMDDDAMAELLSRYGDAVEEFENRGGYDLEYRAATVLTGLGIMPEDHHRPVDFFSGGWKMRISLAGILTLNPDVLLLDEPTNHLDIESIIWLEEWLSSSFKGSLVMTCHDRDFMNRIVSRIVEVADKSITSYGGNYDFYEEQREIRKEQLLAGHRRQTEMLAKEEAFISRFAARASHASQVQSRIKKLEKIDRIEIPAEERRIRFEFSEPPRSGDDVVNIKNLGKSWQLEDGTQKPVFSGITGRIRRLEKIAVTGINGAGKSTFLKVIAGKTEPSEGIVEIGANVQLGYFSQMSMDVLDADKTVFETVQDALPQSSIGVIRSLCGAFLFSKDAADKKICTLSGGEKSRVILATLLARPINFLVLDEPTNHLDMQSREILLEALKDFGGTLILVSHDRYFLRSLVNRVIEIDHGRMRMFEGSYEYYLDSRENS